MHLSNLVNADTPSVLKELEREEAMRKKKKSQSAQQQPQLQKVESTQTLLAPPTPEQAEGTEDQETSTKDTFY